MSIPTTPTHTAQKRRYNSEALYSPGDPFVSSYITPSNKINGNITKFTEGVFDDAREDISELFVRLPEEHPSHNHQVHAIKSAQTNKLEFTQDSIKTVQKVKTGLAIVLTDENHAETIIGKVEAIVANLGGKVEKAEEWHTYLVDHVPRRLTLLEGSNWEVIEEWARKEVQSITGLTRTRINWSRKTLENPLPTGL
ncbi:hypothetical protein EPUL_005641 [Erysiphe pulchra]|uniref:Uncharacterized protein n=1 Tax=Erysiphe pulchra TaxID=225359 RepID=A0A2S4PL86_9PEZI|nr:hypothetical protein EPUL_005641 [Erysiphe pulchra]